MTDVARCAVCRAELTSGRCVTCSDAPTTPREGLGPEASDAVLLFDELAEALAPQFLLIRLLGHGGMGLVYLARDPALKRLVAVKVLAPRLAQDETARTRFAREAETMAAMSHPHIVGVYQVGELPRSGTSYFIMQHVDGASLREEYPRGHPVAEGKARRCIGEIASALAAAHRLGVVHRDVKPANVMVDRESGRYLVLDFGISAVLPLPEVGGDRGPSLTSENIRVGTPVYMSPEQAAGEGVSGKSDVYSLGCMAYEMLTGELPFSGGTPIEVIAAHILRDAPKVKASRPELDPQFADLIDRCLAKTPDSRPSAEEVARALLPSFRSVIEWPPPGLEPLKGFGRHWLRTAALAALVAAAFFLALMMQPTVSRPCCWREAESSRLWETLKHLSYLTPIRFDDPDAMSVWYFLLDGIFIVLLFCVPLVVARSWQLARRLVPGRRPGYPWRVLLEVAWDDTADTGDLLNGTGAYSLWPEAERARVRSHRRTEWVLALTAVALAIAAPTVWLYAGGHIAWPPRAPVVGYADALVLWFPPAVALTGSLLASLAGSRGVAGSRRRREAWAGQPPVPVIRRELVSVWLRSAGLEPTAPRTAFSVWAVPAGTSVLLIALLLTTVLVLSVVFKSTVRMVASAAEARAWIQEASAVAAPHEVEPPSPRAAVALAAAPVAGWNPDLARVIAASKATWPRLESAGDAVYCLTPRRVLFGSTSRRVLFGSSVSAVLTAASGEHRNDRLTAWIGDALEGVGLTGLVRRSNYCSSVLGSEVTTVDKAQ